MRDKKIIYFASFAFGIALIIFLVLFFMKPKNNLDEIESVNINNNGNSLAVNSDGSVVYATDEGVYFDQWNSEKTKAFFNYFTENYSKSNEFDDDSQNFVTISINGQNYKYALNNDEIVNAASEDATQEDNNGGSENNDSGGDDDSVNQYFSPTPFPTSPNNQTPTPTPYQSTYNPFDECLYWILSYCVIPKTPTPSPVSTSVEVEIKLPDCTDNLETGRTVITNELCLPTPSPTPTS